MRAIADHPPPPARVGRADHDLLRASLHRPELFADIFDRHAAALHQYLSRRVGDHADDLLSETFLTAFRKRAQYRPERVDVRPWLYGIAGNLVRRLRREEVARYRALARSAEAERVPGSCEDLDAAVDRLDAGLVGARLAAALAALQPRDREVLLLVAWADLGYADVAAALDIPLGTVRSRLNRARRLVRHELASSDLPSALQSPGPADAPVPVPAAADPTPDPSATDPSTADPNQEPR